MKIKIPYDKVLHFSISALGTILFTNIAAIFVTNPLISITIGTGIILTAGILKEIIDSSEEGNKFDWNDIVADILGCTTGVALTAITCI